MPMDEKTNLLYWQDHNPPRGETMRNLDKRIADLEKALTPGVGEYFEGRNDRGEVIFRNEYSPAAGKWIRTIERPDLRTYGETWYQNEIPIHRLEEISILDL